MDYAELVVGYNGLYVQTTRTVIGDLGHLSHSYKKYDGPVDDEVLRQLSEYLKKQNSEVKVMAFSGFVGGEKVLKRIEWMQDKGMPDELGGEGLWGLVSNSGITGETLESEKILLFREL